jgi:hypothetical protein
METENLVKKKIFHTNAEYRCKIIDVKKDFYITKMIKVFTNDDKKTLYIPRRNIFVNKDLISEKLKKYDFINLKLTLQNKGYNIEVLSFYEVKKQSNKEIKTEEKPPKINTNPYALLALSDSDSN